MDDGTRTTAAARLTARGARTRARIVDTAMELIRVRGVGGTTLDDVVAVSNVSKSQLYRHFTDKSALVRAVIELVGEQTLDAQRAHLARIRSFAGLRRWRDSLIEANALNSGRYGCSLGSIANEVADHDEAARTQLDALFRLWDDLFRQTFHRLRAESVIPADVDVDPLATAFVAAVQGGYLLAQSARDVAPMAAAIDMAIEHLQLLAER